MKSVSDSLPNDQIYRTTPSTKLEPPPNQLSNEKQNKENLDNKKTVNIEVNGPEVDVPTSSFPSIPPPIDSHVLLLSRIVPEAPIQNEILQVPDSGNGRHDIINEQQVPVKSTERRIDQLPAIPILRLEVAENNKNGEKRLLIVSKILQ